MTQKNDQVWLITGANKGLGAAIAKEALDRGYKVVATARNPESAAKILVNFPNLLIAKLDITNDEQVQSAVKTALDQFGRIDVLVNNAHELAPSSGFNTPAGSLEQATMDVWMRNLTAGVCWPALTVQKIGAGMKDRGRGSIINISTMYAVVAPRPALYEGTTFLNPPAYSASKAAMIAFTRYVASFWGSYGIRANAILPGPFSNTEDAGLNSVQAGDPFIEKLKANTCLGRIGRAGELAGALLFLASEASSYVTGQSIVVDGGWTAV